MTGEQRVRSVVADRSAFNAHRWPLVVLLAAALAACGGAPKRGGSAGTPTQGGGYYLDDGPGASAPANLDAIPDAVPKAEPLYRG
ncbi:MAG: hypothetical protein H6R21_2423, partial [Proteobacteria bacterium]|nr:hypothetical protein [Pseudomonadota bacterium]